MVQLMSQSDFASGGPYGGGTGSAASGLAKLADVFTQAPMVRAKAGYYGAETEHARAQTEQLRQQMGITTGRQDRINEAMAILTTPGALHDPNNAARLSAIALADPDIAAHFPGLLAGITAAGALSKAYTDEEAAKTAGATGVAAYGNTQPGYREGLQNRIREIQEAGAQNRVTADDQVVQAIPPNAPPGTQPTSMRRRDANAQGMTILSDQAVTTNVGPTQVLDPATGRPMVSSGGAAQRTGATPVLGTDPAQGVVMTNSMYPPLGGGAPPSPPSGPFQGGPVTLPSSPPPAATPPPGAQGANTATPPPQQTGQADTGDGTSINLARADLDNDGQDNEGGGDSDLAAMMSGVKQAQAVPSASVPGAVRAAGPAAGTPPTPPATPPTPPVSTTAAPSPVPQPAPANTAPSPQPGGLGQQFQDEQLARAQRAGQIIRALKGEPPLVPPTVDVSPDTEAKIKKAVGASATTRYPLDPNATMGRQGYAAQWSPEAYDAIHQRVGQLFASTDPRFRGNVDTSIQQAISELETSGRIPPSGYASQQSLGGDWFGGWGVGGGAHTVALAPPGSKFDAQGNRVFPNQGGTQTKAAPVPPTPNSSNPPQPNQSQTQMTIRVNPQTGQRWGQIPGSGQPWFLIDANNQPVQSNAQGQ